MHMEHMTETNLAHGSRLTVRSRWTRFLLGLAALLSFAFGIIPALQRLEPVRNVRNAIRETDIDATALVYSECDVSFRAEASLRDSLRYAPGDIDD
jgi:hypothetical protein